MRAKPLPPSRLIILKASAICRCCLSRRLTSATSTPAPAAMRRLREAWRMSGLRRSALVMDEMIAACRSRDLSEMLASAICFLTFWTPGRRPIRPSMPPMRFIWASWSAIMSRSNWPLASRRAMASALAASRSWAAFSTRATMSPWPRMRPATRAASKTSRPSIFSETPRNLMGRPVTARMDRAAPPRPSPSARVRTRPVRGRRSWKALAVRTASWPVRLSATSRVSCGWAMAAISAASAIMASSTVVRPAVSRMTTSKPCSRAADRARRAMSGADWPAMIGRLSTPAWTARVASCSMAAGRRVSREASRTFLRSRERRRASLAAVVVLPEPWRPAIRMTVGGFRLRFRPSAPSPPSISTRPS